MGGLEKNKPTSKRTKEGRGPVNKTGIIGAKDRETGRVKAGVLEDGKGETLKKFVRENIIPGATLFTDENRGYVHLGDEYGGEYKHESVRHSARNTWTAWLTRTALNRFGLCSKEVIMASITT